MDKRPAKRVCHLSPRTCAGDVALYENEVRFLVVRPLVQPLQRRLLELERIAEVRRAQGLGIRELKLESGVGEQALVLAGVDDVHDPPAPPRLADNGRDLHALGACTKDDEQRFHAPNLRRAADSVKTLAFGGCAPQISGMSDIQYVLAFVGGVVFAWTGVSLIGPVGILLGPIGFFLGIWAGERE